MKANRIDWSKSNYAKLQDAFFCDSANNTCPFGTQAIPEAAPVDRDIDTSASEQFKQYTIRPAGEKKAKTNDIIKPNAVKKNKKVNRIDGSKINYKGIMSVFGIVEDEPTVSNTFDDDDVSGSSLVYNPKIMGWEPKKKDSACSSYEQKPAGLGPEKHKNCTKKICKPVHCKTKHHKLKHCKIKHCMSKHYKFKCHKHKSCWPKDITQFQSFFVNPSSIFEKIIETSPFISLADIERYSKYTKAAAGFLEAVIDRFLASAEDMEDKFKSYMNESCRNNLDIPCFEQVFREMFRSAEDFFNSITITYTDKGNAAASHESADQ